MASPGLYQSQTQVQTQVLAPQLRQSLKILQIPAQELRNAILEELETNPTLEELPIDSLSLQETAPLAHDENTAEDEDVFLQRLTEDDERWTQHLREENRLNAYSADKIEAHQHFIASITLESSLQEHLIKEARLAGATVEVAHALEHIIGSLDDNGFLKTPLQELVQDPTPSRAQLTDAIDLLKTLEPVGLGASDIQECLIWQLEMKITETSRLAIKILKSYYPFFIRRRIPELAKALSTSQETIQDVFELISTLDPAPGRKFKADQNHVVVPDVTVERVESQWIISLESEYVPRLRLSPMYRNLIQAGTLSAQEKTYLHDKIKSGELLISAIAQRQETIRRITEKILELQKPFFEVGIRGLQPMNMQKIATALGLHETTISRAVANKYLHTPHGIFEMKAFFTTGYTTSAGETVSARSVKEAISQLIASENPAKPLSDQQLVKNLTDMNLAIARRTIAKYRDELGILPTHLRRRF